MGGYRGCGGCHVINKYEHVRFDVTSLFGRNGVTHRRALSLLGCGDPLM